jgi:curli biogenesis system outer membrane secretion channel CsgG
MKTAIPAALSLWLIPTAFSAFCPAQELSKGEKDTVLIGSLKIQPTVNELARRGGYEFDLKRLSESLETQFISAINATRIFQLVERRRKDDLELEQAFAMVAVDPNDKNAAKPLKMAGAKYAFLPQIDSFEVRRETRKFESMGKEVQQRVLYLSAVVQVVDTTTGKMLPDAPSIQLSKTEEGKAEGAVGTDQAIVELSKDMAGKLSQGVVELIRPAKVLTVTGKQVHINRGAEVGFVPGVRVEVYAAQDVKDEDTGETFRNEVPVGQGKIVRGDARQSFAMIEGEDAGVAKGCVVRVIQEKNQEAPPSRKNEVPATKAPETPAAKKDW